MDQHRGFEQSLRCFCSAIGNVGNATHRSCRPSNGMDGQQCDHQHSHDIPAEARPFPRRSLGAKGEIALRRNITPTGGSNIRPSSCTMLSAEVGFPSCGACERIGSFSTPAGEYPVASTNGIRLSSKAFTTGVTRSPQGSRQVQRHLECGRPAGQGCLEGRCRAEHLNPAWVRLVAMKSSSSITRTREEPCSTPKRWRFSSIVLCQRQAHL